MFELLFGSMIYHAKQVTSIIITEMEFFTIIGQLLKSTVCIKWPAGWLSGFYCKPL